MFIRTATHKDIADLCELRWEFVNVDRRYPKTDKERFVADTKEFLEAMLNKSYLIFCAFEGEELIGTVYAGILFKPSVPNKPVEKLVYITSVYVRPSYRKRGVGDDLIENVRSWANNNAVENMIVWPKKGVEEFYEKNGFTHETSIYEITK